MKYYKFLFIFFLFLVSCRVSEKKKDDISLDSLILSRNHLYVNYDIPLPVDLYKIIIKKGKYLPENKANLPLKNSRNKIETSLLLGIMSADLAYSTLSENKQTVLDYSDACSKLAAELDVAEAFNLSYLTRIKNNIQYRDSLVLITNEAYKNVCNLMENKGMTNFLPIVVYAGWIEAFHLALNSVENEEKDTSYLGIFEATKIDNLIDYMYDAQIKTSAYKYNYVLKQEILDLMNLKQLFEDYKKDATALDRILEFERSLRFKIVNLK